MIRVVSFQMKISFPLRLALMEVKLCPLYCALHVNRSLVSFYISLSHLTQLHLLHLIGSQHFQISLGNFQIRHFPERV